MGPNAPPSSPFPIWLCGVSTRFRVERVHSCSVCVNSEVSPDQAWPFERMSRGNILYFLPSSPWLEPAAACVLWLALTLCDCSPSENKTVSSFSPSGTKTWERKLAVLLSLNNTETGRVDLDFVCKTDFPPWTGPFFCHLLAFANMPALFAAACWFNACSCLPSFATQRDELF